MKWLRTMGLVLCVAGLVPVAAGAADGAGVPGKIIGSGDGYEIRLAPSEAVALVNAPAPIQSLLAPVDAAPKARSPLVPPASATGGVFMVSDAASPAATVPPEGLASTSSSFVYLNRLPDVIVYHGLVVIGQRGIDLSGTVVYSNLLTGEKTSFLVDAREVLSAVADEHYLYMLKSVTTSDPQGASPAMAAATHMVLTAQPLSKKGDVSSVTIDRKTYSTGIPLPANLTLSIKDGVIIVGSLDHYTFDGKAFKVVH